MKSKFRPYILVLTAVIVIVLAAAVWIVNARSAKIVNEPVETLVNHFMTWKAGPWREGMDMDNPYRQAMVERSEQVVPYILENPPGMSLEMIWLLGEIGDTRCFDILLKEYRKQPGSVRACSLAACTDKDNIGRLLDALNDFDKNSLLKLLDKPFSDGKTYDEVKNFDNDQLQKWWAEHLDEIRQRCMERCTPQLG